MKAINEQQIVLDCVDVILAKQSGRKKWGKEEHSACIIRVHRECESISENEEEMEMAFSKCLNFKGLAGNSSQFLQFLQSDKGSKRIAKTEEIEVTLSEYLKD